MWCGLFERKDCRSRFNTTLLISISRISNLGGELGQSVDSTKLGSVRCSRSCYPGGKYGQKGQRP